jgi:hypothetical protein
MPKAGERVDASLRPAELEAFPLDLRTRYAYHWNLSLGQVVESAQMLNISYVRAAGQ